MYVGLLWRDSRSRGFPDVQVSANMLSLSRSVHSIQRIVVQVLRTVGSRIVAIDPEGSFLRNGEAVRLKSLFVGGNGSETRVSVTCVGRPIAPALHKVNTRSAELSATNPSVEQNVAR